MTAADGAPFALDEFLQVADRIAERIKAGEFGEGGRLPSAPQLCEHYGAGAGVIRHARQELKLRGLIVIVPGKGAFTA